MTDLLTRALDHHKCEEFAKARKLYRKLLRADPGSVDALHLLGVTLGQQERYLEGINYMRQANELNPEAAIIRGNLVRAHFAYATKLFGEGRLDTAIHHYREVLRLNPKAAKARSSLCMCLTHTDRPR